VVFFSEAEDDGVSKQMVSVIAGTVQSCSQVTTKECINAQFFCTGWMPFPPPNHPASKVWNTKV